MAMFEALPVGVRRVKRLDFNGQALLYFLGQLDGRCIPRLCAANLPSDARVVWGKYDAEWDRLTLYVESTTYPELNELWYGAMQSEKVQVDFLDPSEPTRKAIADEWSKRE